MKLIVSDFDLTFFDSDYNENIQLINSVVEKGNVFVIATGRSIELLKKDIENKNIKFQYLICSDGSVILNDKFEILQSVVFESEIINPIIEKIKNDENLELLDIDKNSTGISAVYAIFNSMEYAKNILDDILKNYDVKGYVSTHGIKIINKNISKVSGIEYIKNKLNVLDDVVYTIGDRINDFEMIDKYNGYLIGKNIDNFQDFIKKIDK